MGNTKEIEGQKDVDIIDWFLIVRKNMNSFSALESLSNSGSVKCWHHSESLNWGGSLSLENWPHSESLSWGGTESKNSTPLRVFKSGGNSESFGAGYCRKGWIDSEKSCPSKSLNRAGLSAKIIPTRLLKSEGVWVFKSTPVRVLKSGGGSVKIDPSPSP